MQHQHLSKNMNISYKVQETVAEAMTTAELLG